ncbi:MAG TPA: SDR family oxidoreductase [Methylomirabilota bacterium]|jgi:3-oxoacyl-[acyl-carrier protein] reductase|nr:SDR family oxidoreductase [Methylomirabilota bacterium]
MRLRDTVALVTGAGRGIGRSIALTFAREGADLALADRAAEGLDAVADEVRGLGRRAVAERADVSREADVARLVGRVLGEFGRVDVLVNNAGTVILPGAILETTLEAWETTMATNARSVFLCTRAVLPAMIERRQGRIINIASTAGLRELADRAAYCASKHAVVGFTRAAALDMKPYGIAVNAIAPGPVDTPLTRWSRPDADKRDWLRPDEIADVAVFLASADARGLTGAIVEVGGWAVFPR